MPTLPIIEEGTTVSQVDNAAQIYGCAMRLARLDATGATPAGASNGLITKNFITLGLSPDINEGQDFSAPNACGEEAFPVKDRPLYRRWNLTMQWEVPDPEAAELIVAAPLILSTAAAPRTLASTGSTVSGSTTLTAPAGAFTGADLGAAVTGTGVGAAAVITQINSTTSVTVSVASTATASGTIAFTITPVALSIGNVAPALGTQASDNGVSLETWAKMFVGGGPAAYLPYLKYAFPRTYWRYGDGEIGNSRYATNFVGYAIENPGWGNGPWNDWVDPSPSTRTLSQAWGKHRTATIPTPVTGYTAVPTQL